MSDKKRSHWILIMIGVMAGMLLMKLISGQGHNHSAHSGPSAQATEQKPKFWTCSMHPQIKLPEKGLCPICAMDLIPMTDGDQAVDDGTVSLTLNSKARQLAEVETTEVIYKEATKKIRLVGKVAYDETRLSYISAWIDGRIDRLFVDFTGTKVRKGDHLIQLYSPELIASQEEYLQAIKNLDQTSGSQLGVMRSTAEETLKSSREKLRLYGISDAQINEIVQRGQTQEHMTINSPVTGTVIHKNGFEGMYVKTGEKVYTIADLSRVWLFLEAYESDLPWLHYGQRVTIEAESHPGQTFQGKIAFIEPFVSDKTRTIKLRVNIDNDQEKLKPGMFVRATINAVTGEGGRVYEEELAGKWICPMHPDIVKDDPSVCDICEMDLIPTKEFGFAENPSMKKKVLVIPVTAPLITGRRAIVYVENTDDETGVHRYEGREIVLGPKADHHYIVESGLREGERVVIKGNFKIDSALQIQAKPSMMNPDGYYTEGAGNISGVVANHENAGILVDAFSAYLQLSELLAAEQYDDIPGQYEVLRAEIERVVQENQWTPQTDGLGGLVFQLRDELQEIDDELEPFRERFGRISDIIKEILSKYEYNESLHFYLSYCPMALGDGGFWLQRSDAIRNPYYGSAMLACGEIKKEYGVAESKAAGGNESHHNH